MMIQAPLQPRFTIPKTTLAVFVYLTKPEAIKPETEALLDETESTRADAFKFAKDREQYIAAHTFLRKTLSRHANLTPEQWQFSANHYGKPFIINPGYEHLHFNLSHTQGLMTCAVSYDTPIGVDVEKVRAMHDIEALCHYALSPSEASDVLSINDTQQKERRFFTYWTLKEAYIKAKGMGLSIPLQSFSFTHTQKSGWQLYIQGDTALTTPDEQWQFTTKQMKTHHLAVGVQQKNRKPIQCVFYTDFTDDDCESNALA